MPGHYWINELPSLFRYIFGKSIRNQFVGKFDRMENSFSLYCNIYIYYIYILIIPIDVYYHVFHFVLLNFRLSNSFQFRTQILTIMFSPPCMWSPSPGIKYSTALPVWSLNQSQCLVPVTVTWSITPGVSNWWRHHSTIEQITPSELALQLRHIATHNSQETQDLQNCTILIQVKGYFVMVGCIMTHLLTDVIPWMGNRCRNKSVVWLF